MRARQVHAGGACGRPHSANLPCSEGRRQARARRTCSCSPSTATDQHHLLTRVAVWMGSPAYTAASRHHHLLTRVAVWMTISSSRRGRAAAAGIEQGSSSSTQAARSSSSLHRTVAMAHETRREGSDRQRRAECIATRVLKHWSHRAAAAFDSSTISHRHHPTIIQEAGRGGNSTKPNKSTLLHMSSPPHFLASTASSYQHPLTIKHQPSTIVMTLSLINTDVADDTVADGRSKQAARTRRSAMAAPGGGSGVRDVAEEWRSWRKSGARGGRAATGRGGPSPSRAGAEALEPSDGGDGVRPDAAS